MSDDRILPNVEDDIPFWDATKDHELRMQRCEDCGNVWWPPAPVCPECWSHEYKWAKLSGRGRVNTWVVFHRAYFDVFADEVPYNVAEIELKEGPRYLANVVGCENKDLYRGMPVEVVFEDVTDEVTLPKFTPLDR